LSLVAGFWRAHDYCESLTGDKPFSAASVAAGPKGFAMSIRSARITRRFLRGGVIAGVVTAATIATAGAALAAPAAPRGLSPTEECVTWSGTVQYFPVLTAKSQKVTAVIEGTLSNCNDFGTPQTFSGSVFGVLSGKATTGKSSLSGQLAVTWPADANLNPSVVPVTLNGASGQFSFGGIVSGGAGKGLDLNSAYDTVHSAKSGGGTLEKIVGTKAFAIYVNEG
jgi:hypothetical protein